MSEKRIAVRYAKSLVDLSVEMKVLETVKDDMLLVKNTCDGSRPLRLMLKNPVVLASKKRIILDQIFKDKVSELTLKFFKILSRKNRLSILPYVADEVLRLYNKINGLQESTVTTSIPLTSDMRAEVIKFVEEVSGKKALLNEKVDKDLIGGFVFKIGDKQIDNSIAGKLNKLKIQLMDA